MSLANPNDSLCVYSFKVKHLSKEIKTLAQPQVALLKAESIGHTFGKLLINDLWNLFNPNAIPGCGFLG